MWLSIFGRVVLLLPLTGPASVYEGAGDFTKWTQTAAVLEIVHSALGESPLPPPRIRRVFAFAAFHERGTPTQADQVLFGKHRTRPRPAAADARPGRLPPRRRLGGCRRVP